MRFPAQRARPAREKPWGSQRIKNVMVVARVASGTSGSNPLSSSRQSISTLNFETMRQDARSFGRYAPPPGREKARAGHEAGPFGSFFSDGHCGSPTFKVGR